MRFRISKRQAMFHVLRCSHQVSKHVKIEVGHKKQSTHFFRSWTTYIVLNSLFVSTLPLGSTNIIMYVGSHLGARCSWYFASKRYSLSLLNTYIYRSHFRCPKIDGDVRHAPAASREWNFISHFTTATSQFLGCNLSQFWPKMK